MPARVEVEYLNINPFQFNIPFLPLKSPKHFPTFTRDNFPTFTRGIEMEYWIEIGEIF